MKAILKILFLCGIIVLTAFSCTKETYEWSGFVEGYVFGSFKCRMESSASVLTPLGYCILLEGSENTDSHYPMDFYTFNLPYEIINYPEDNQTAYCNGSNCGPVFFLDSMTTKYKIRFRYRYLNENEREKFSCGMCTAMLQMFPWDDFKEVTLKDITRINE